MKNRRLSSALLAAGVLLLSTSGVMELGAQQGTATTASTSARNLQPGETRRVPITVEREQAGAPVTFGIPLPEGDLYSVMNVRVLNRGGAEIPSQITPVTTWMPVDESVKWMWVDFFTEGTGQYTVEYGPGVRRTVEVESPITFVNNQRENGEAEIDTGPLRFTIGKGGSGFFDRIEYNPDADGFREEHLIAEGIGTRGSFLDLMDEAGIDTSSAVVHQQFIEKGSGPLHAIVRVEGEYRYSRPDNPTSPFVTYIHAYAGKSYVRVLHTITYTGVPDRSAPLEGRQHRDVMTQGELMIDEAARSADPGLTQPNDVIAAAGFGLDYHIDGTPVFRTGVFSGDYWDEDAQRNLIEVPVAGQSELSVFQTGPAPNGIRPENESGMDDRITGFSARVEGNSLIREAQRAEGWIDLSDGERGISIGIRNMLEEYPNELAVNVGAEQIFAYTWPSSAGPKSFERWSGRPDGGMVGNFAQGITKTSELIFNFHRGNAATEEIREAVNVVLEPAVPHADPEWYRASGVYGTFAAADNDLPVLERGLQYKFDYMQFNQKWAPWYGMFDYGDMKIYFRNGRWQTWGNNEPAEDFQWWMNFIRTGDPEDFITAEAMSRHTMDIDNIHWPAAPKYRGDTNASLDWWNFLKEPQGSPYVGVGARHSEQQATSMLSAHVWVPGWIASYYLAGNHRGLEVAKLTGDLYMRRIFGDHDLRGRRLYLSVWNMAELYDATKDDDYLEELQFRVDLVLDLAKEQGGRLVIDRYGYSQNYASHGLTKYLQMFDSRPVELALMEHGRNLLENEPLDHEMESFLSSIHPLVTAYDLSGHEEFLMEACRRAVHLRTAEMAKPFESYTTQRQLALQMEAVSSLPGRAEGEALFNGRFPIWMLSGGLRIFGWTHANGVPYLIDRLQTEGSTLGQLPCA